MKTAIVTGISGQGGAYMAQLLLEKGYAVLGVRRRSSSSNLWRLAALGIEDHPRLRLVDFDLTDFASCVQLVRQTDASELYNLAAASYVGVSFDQPIAVTAVTGFGVLHLLDAIRLERPAMRFFQASSSEMFGRVDQAPQDEHTPFHPRNPYGVAKLFAHSIGVNYREAYGLFVCNGILYNHESPLRGKEFVTRKITHTVARIKLGRQEHLELGNIDATRDWGYAKEYVEGMWRMMQAKAPGDYVLATNRSSTVRDFVTMAFRAVDVGLRWDGEAEQEIGVDVASGKTVVRINPKFYRPNQRDILIGRAEKARVLLGWEAATKLDHLCKMMVEADLARIASGSPF